MSNLKEQKGFTLIEMLVYLALFAFIMTSALAGAYQIIEHNGRTRSSTLRVEEEHFILRKMASMLSGPASIDVPIDEGEVLVINTGGDTKRFKTDNGIMFLNDEPLSNGITDIADLWVKYEPSAKHLLVTFSADGEVSPTSTFYIR